MIRDVLRNPDRFFRERTPKLPFPQTFTIVFFVAISTSAAVGIMGRWLSQAITTASEGDGSSRFRRLPFFYLTILGSA
ncbi:hypothetical protein [Haladaptatus cibarius]|uniref:hypothetical protein n=1 Tax=Haladaptatus cibarius TaxID=453847 RepID=UPI00067961AF|nr:hypothetical protein [Haladaptatus cibarius]